MLELNGTVIAVMVNFVILIVLLNKVLYKPLLKLIDDRQKYVEDTLAEAERHREEGKTLQQEYEMKVRQARHEEQRIVEEANRFAEQIRRESMQKARGEVEELFKASRHEIQEMKKEAIESVKTEFINLAILASGKIMKERLDAERDRALIMEVVEKAGMIS